MVGKLEVREVEDDNKKRPIQLLALFIGLRRIIGEYSAMSKNASVYSVKSDEYYSVKSDE